MIQLPRKAPGIEKSFYTAKYYKIKQRAHTRIKVFVVPIEHLLFKLKARGFSKRDRINMIYPTAIRGLVRLSHLDIHPGP
jgi:hypothetical protein